MTYKPLYDLRLSDQILAGVRDGVKKCVHGHDILAERTTTVIPVPGRYQS